MITQPLELVSRLSPPPRSFDLLHFVNVVLVALCFSLFGSRFVLSPGLAITLPKMETAVAQAAAATVVINLPAADTVIVDDAVLRAAGLQKWLQERASRDQGGVLLIRASQSVPLSELVRLADLALAAGFDRVQVAAEELRATEGAATSPGPAR